MGKEVERHVTLLEYQHDMLRALAKMERRSMRNTVAILVEEAMKKLKAKK